MTSGFAKIMDTIKYWSQMKTLDFIKIKNLGSTEVTMERIVV